MDTEVSSNRERLTNDLENWLVYFANRQKKAVSREEAAELSQRVMANLDIEDPAFAHKGPSWLALEIIRNRD
ncbi:hypothetical protein [Planomicrobium sp. MB-3u-38]|uniref:hypothetical protein n=1 Tax=Planomicrobium sp. MB-3u-38 TaxID=2058318 RepID=UPI000C7DB9EC|nr:hypothetical protein [Planomicrobium sp. MB-3u-38]PKH10588.1 hypothetical protein CXF70_08950 [Planomicrobium sp. MB-3u-38]